MCSYLSDIRWVVSTKASPEEALMDWRDRGTCTGFDPELWYDMYENDPKIRGVVDTACMSCPVQQVCFGTGVSNDEWGVWGGVYLEEGTISETFNSHKTAKDWNSVWESLTLELNDVLD